MRIPEKEERSNEKIFNKIMAENLAKLIEKQSTGNSMNSKQSKCKKMPKYTYHSKNVKTKHK